MPSPIHGAGRRSRCCAPRSSWSSSTPRSWSWRCRRSTPTWTSRRRPAVGAERLPAELRRPAAARRARRRPARAPARVHGRHRPVRARLARVRAGRLVRGADRGPRHPGRRGGDHDPDRALDRDDHLRGGRRSATRRSASGPRSAASAPPPRGWSAARSPTGSAGSGSSSSTCRSRSPWSRSARCCCARAATAAHGRRFDVAGAVTITAALVALVYAVVEAPDAGWASGQTLGLLAALRPC